MLTTLALAALHALLQGDVLTWPLIAAVLALLAISGVASAITAALRRVYDAGGSPQTVVYLVCAVLVTIGYFISGGHLPLIDPANPAATVAGWLVLVTLLAEFTKVFYDVVLSKVWPGPAPA